MEGQEKESLEDDSGKSPNTESPLEVPRTGSPVRQNIYYKVAFQAASIVGLSAEQSNAIAQRTAHSLASELDPTNTKLSQRKLKMNFLTTLEQAISNAANTSTHPHLPAPSRSIVKQAWETELHRLTLSSVAKKISPKDHQIYLLFYFEHWSTKRICEELGESPFSVFTTRLRVRAWVGLERLKPGRPIFR